MLSFVIASLVRWMSNVAPISAFWNIRFFSLIISLFMLFSCTIIKTSVGTYTEEGICYQENRNLAPFTSMKVSGSFNVYFHQSDKYYILVEGDENSVHSLISEVIDGTLFIQLKHGQYKNLTLRVSVYSPSIDLIQLSGSGRLICDEIHVPKGLLRCQLSGSGHIEVNKVSCKTFEGSAEGSGKLIIGRIDSNALFLSLVGSTSSSLGESNTMSSSYLSLRGSGNLTINEIKTGGDLHIDLIGKGIIMVLKGQCDHLLVSTDKGGEVRGHISYNMKETNCFRGGYVVLN